MSVSKNTGNLLTNSQISEFVKKEFSEIKSNSDLVYFHSINKFLLMAHSPDRIRLLGNIVANHKILPFKTLLDEYDKNLEILLKNEPTTKLHANVLQKIFGYFKKDLSAEEKSKILMILSDYRQNKQTLNDVLLLLEGLTRKFQKTYLVRQTYFLLYAKVSKTDDISI